MSYIGLLPKQNVTNANADNITSGTLNNDRLPLNITGRTYNGVSLLSDTIGFVISGGTTSKALTIGNNLTLLGNDGASLNIGTGGTLGSAAFHDYVNGIANRTVFTATANQTTFNITYDIGFVDVYLNGIKLVIGTDFTASNGTTIVLSTGATAGNTLDVMAYSMFNVANTYTVSQADTLLSNKQSNLVSGTNLKTINGNNLLGSGDLVLQQGTPYTRLLFQMGAK